MMARQAKDELLESLQRGGGMNPVTMARELQEMNKQVADALRSRKDTADAMMAAFKALELQATKPKSPAFDAEKKSNQPCPVPYQQMPAANNMFGTTTFAPDPVPATALRLRGLHREGCARVADAPVSTDVQRPYAGLPPLPKSLMDYEEFGFPRCGCRTPLVRFLAVSGTPAPAARLQNEMFRLLEDGERAIGRTSQDARIVAEATIVLAAAEVVFLLTDTWPYVPDAPASVVAEMQKRGRKVPPRLRHHLRELPDVPPATFHRRDLEMLLGALVSRSPWLATHVRSFDVDELVVVQMLETRGDSIQRASHHPDVAIVQRLLRVLKMELEQQNQARRQNDARIDAATQRPRRRLLRRE